MASDEERARQREQAERARAVDLASVASAISQLQFAISRCQPHMTMVFNECRRAEGITAGLIGGKVGATAIIAQLELARTNVADIQLNLDAAVAKLREMQTRLRAV